MGVEYSRSADLPINIDERESEIVDSWQYVSNNPLNAQDEKSSTLGNKYIHKIGSIIQEHFDIKTTDDSTLVILDPICGNCVASNIIKTYTSNVKCSDIIDRNKPNTTKCNTIESIRRFGSDVNTLMLISPVPSGDFTDGNIPCDQGYSDYFAVRDFINMKKESKNKNYIIFAGELGASDGSKGMYEYMMEHPNLKLELRNDVHCWTDFIGDTIEKELFIFQILTSQ